jgi:glycosyltransferase involved in cell wall biosynthesis
MRRRSLGEKFLDQLALCVEILSIVDIGKRMEMGPLISLIVPVWGDDDLVVDLVSVLSVAPELAEWIVVAVRPTERLQDLDRQRIIRLISWDAPSRGAQMNAGAKAARGIVLCFHHSDSELRSEHLSALEKVARNHTIVGGAFHRRFHPQRGIWREPMVRWLSERGGPLFGDQSIFVKATAFHQLGGFADIPLMEDMEFSRRLRRLGNVVLLDPPIWSPPRNPSGRGPRWRTVRNAAFIVLFYFGVDPHTLHRWYYRQSWIRSNPDQYDLHP